MKKVLIGFAVLVVLLIGAALVGPSFVDWNQYRSEIAARVKAATGRNLIIDGRIDLSVLPAPTLSVENVRFASVPGAANAYMAQLKSLDVRVALMPLLEGTIQVESVALVEPVIELEVLPDGRFNWDFTAADADGAAATPAREGARGGPAFQLDHLRVENGTVVYRESSAGIVGQVDKFTAEISAGSLSGPFNAVGTASAYGLPLEFDIAAGRLDRTGSVPLRLRLAAADAEVDFKGSVTNPAEAATVIGRLRARGGDLRKLVVAVLSATGRVPSLPVPLSKEFSLDAIVQASAAEIDLDELAFDLGETRATGRVNLKPGSPLRGDVSLALGSVDLDRWFAALPSQTGKGEQERARGSDAVFLTGGLFAGGLDLPRDTDLSLVLAVDGMTYRTGVISQMQLGARLAKGQLVLHQLTAQLPGGSDFALSGTLGRAKAGATFDGALEIDSSNFRGMLDWLRIDVDQVPRDRLRKLSLVTKVQLAPDQVQLRDVDLGFDATRLVGGATVALRPPYAFGASFAVDRLNLDAYFPPADTDKKGGDGRAEDSEVSPLGALALLGALNANLNGRIESLTARGHTIEQLRFDGTLHGGGLTVRSASVGDLAGLKGSISGSAGGFQDKPFYDITADLAAPNLAPLFRMADYEPPIPAAELGAAAFKGSVRGDFETVALDSAIKLAGGAYEIAGTVALPESGPEYDLRLKIDHPDPGPLARHAFDEGLAKKLETILGAVKLAGHFRGDAATLSVSGLDLTSGLIDAVGDVAVSGYPAKPVVNANIDATAKDPAVLAAVLEWRPPVPLADLGPIRFRGTAKGEEDGFDLDADIVAKGGRVRIAGRVDNTDAGPRYDLEIGTDHPKPTALARALMPDHAVPEIGAILLTAKVKGDTSRVAISDLEARTDIVDAAGRLDLTGLDAVLVFDADMDVTAKAPVALLELADIVPPAFLAKLGAVRAQGTAAGGKEAVVVDVALTATGGRAKVAGGFAFAEAGPSYDLSLDVQHPDLAALARRLTGDRTIRNLGALAFSGKAKGDPDNVAITDLSAASDLLRANGFLDLRDYNRKPAVNADLDIRVPDLPMVVDLIGVAVPDIVLRLSDLAVKGKAQGDENGFSIDAELASSGGTGHIDGRVALLDSGPRYDVSVDVRHPDFVSFMRILDPLYDPAETRMGDIRLAAVVRGTEDSATFTELKGNVGPVRAAGDVHVALGGERPSVSARLSTSEIVVDQFLPPKGMDAGGESLGRGQRKVSQRWSRAPLDLSDLLSLDGDLALASTAITYDIYRVDQANASLTLADGVLNIRRIAGQMYDGAVDLNGRMIAKDEPRLRATVQVRNADVGRAAASLLETGTIKLTKGRLDFTMDFETRGGSESDLVGNLNGAGGIHISNGEVEGFDLSAVSKRLRGLDGGGLDLLGLVQTGMTGGSTNFERVNGTFNITQGNLVNKDLEILADGGAGSGAGTVDLAAWNMDYKVDFRLTGVPNAPPFAMELKGPPDQPRKFFHVNQLQSFLLGRGIGAVVKGVGQLGVEGVGGVIGGAGKIGVEGVGAIVRGVLGSGTPRAQPGATPEIQPDAPPVPSGPDRVVRRAPVPPPLPATRMPAAAPAPETAPQPLPTVPGGGPIATTGPAPTGPAPQALPKPQALPRPAPAPRTGTDAQTPAQGGDNPLEGLLEKLRQGQ